MHETRRGSRALQALLDRSYERGGGALPADHHARTPARRRAGDRAARRHDVAGARDRDRRRPPAQRPVDGIFYRGSFYFGSRARLGAVPAHRGSARG